MKYAIVDMAVTGHHFEYLYGLCDQIRLNKANMNFDLYCSSKLFDYIKENELLPVSDIPNLTIITDTLEAPITGGWFHKTRIAYKNIKCLKSYTNILFMAINVYFPALTLFSLLNFKSLTISGIYFNPFIRAKPNYKDKIRDFSLKVICKKYKKTSIFVLNDLESVQQLNKRYGVNCFHTLVDPIPTFFYRQKKQEPPKDGELLTYLMIGSLSERKGVLEYLKAIKNSNSQQCHIFAGKVAESIKTDVENSIEELKNKGLKIDLLNKFLSNNQFAELIDKSNILVIPYLSKGASSGILGHAAYRGKSVIGPNEGLLKEIIEENDLGVCINPLNEQQFEYCLINGLEIINKSNPEKNQTYFINNSYKTFYSTLIKPWNSV